MDIGRLVDLYIKDGYELADATAKVPQILQIVFLNLYYINIQGIG